MIETPIIGGDNNHGVGMAVTVILLLALWKLWEFLFRAGFCYLAIMADSFIRMMFSPQHFIRRYFCFAKYPSDSQELIQNLDYYAPIVADNLKLPFNLKMVPITKKATSAEPLKNALLVGTQLIYHKPNQQPQEQKLNIFWKFQCGGNMPLSLRILRWVVENDVSREVDFYQKVAMCINDDLPIRVAKPYWTHKSPITNTVCIALEHIPLTEFKELNNNQNKTKDSIDANDHLSEKNVTIMKEQEMYFTLADHEITTHIPVYRIIERVARMNAKFAHFSPADRHDCIKWIPASKGVNFAEWAHLFPAPALFPYKPLFKAVHEYFLDKPVTLVHGDCRPGNMIFVGDKTKNDFVPVDVIFSDWEATNVAPLLQDFTYCVILGLPANSPKLQIRKLCEVYRSNFIKYLPEGSKIDIGSVDDMLDQHELLGIILRFVSGAVGHHEVWDRHGNSSADWNVWNDRVVRHHNTDEAVVWRLLGPYLTAHGYGRSFVTNYMKVVDSMVNDFKEKETWSK